MRSPSSSDQNRSPQPSCAVCGRPAVGWCCVREPCGHPRNREWRCQDHFVVTPPDARTQALQAELAREWRRFQMLVRDGTEKGRTPR